MLNLIERWKSERRAAWNVLAVLLCFAFGAVLYAVTSDGIPMYAQSPVSPVSPIETPTPVPTTILDVGTVYITGAELGDAGFTVYGYNTGDVWRDDLLYAAFDGVELTEPAEMYHIEPGGPHLIAQIEWRMINVAPWPWDALHCMSFWTGSRRDVVVTVCDGSEDEATPTPTAIPEEDVPWWYGCDVDVVVTETPEPAEIPECRATRTIEQPYGGPPIPSPMPQPDPWLGPPGG